MVLVLQGQVVSWGSVALDRQDPGAQLGQVGPEHLVLPFVLSDLPRDKRGHRLQSTYQSTSHQCCHILWALNLREDFSGVWRVGFKPGRFARADCVQNTEQQAGRGSVGLRTSGKSMRHMAGTEGSRVHWDKVRGRWSHLYQATSGVLDTCARKCLSWEEGERVLSSFPQPQTLSFTPKL